MTYKIERWKRSRFWAVLDAAGGLVCLCVYKKGAASLVQRLQGDQELQEARDAPV